MIRISLRAFFLLTKADLKLLTEERVIDFHNLKFMPCFDWLVHHTGDPHTLLSAAQRCTHIQVQMAADVGLRHTVNIPKSECQRAEGMPVLRGPVWCGLMEGTAPTAAPTSPWAGSRPRSYSAWLSESSQLLPSFPAIFLLSFLLIPHSLLHLLHPTLLSRAASLF